MRIPMIRPAYMLLLLTFAAVAASAQPSSHEVTDRLSELVVNAGAHYNVSGYGDDDNNNHYNNDDDDNNNHYNNDDNNDDDHYSNDDDNYNNDDDDDNNDIPLDGGLSFLALAGAGFGIKKIRDNRMKNKDTNNQQK